MPDVLGRPSHGDVRRWSALARLWPAASAILTVVLLGGLIITWVPLTGESLFEATVELHKRPYAGRQMLHVYSGVHGRPTETCDTFLLRQDATIETIRSELAGADSRSGAVRLIGTIRVLDRRMRELFSSVPEESCWKEFSDYAYFQAGFPSDGPYIWTFRRLGLSTVHIVLALIVGSWAGLVCLFLIAGRLSGSRGVGLATVALTILVWRLWHFPTGAYIYILNCFVPVWLGMRLSSRPASASSSTRARSLAVDTILIGFFGLHSILQVFIYPFTHRVNGAVVALTVLAIGVLRWDRYVLARGVALLIAVNVVAAPYYHDMRATYRQLTSQNLAANEGFLEGQMAWGLFERPTYLGLPNGDYGFTWMHAIDPYLYYTAPHLIVHQAFKHFGTTVLREVLLTSPLTLVEAVGKRLFIQTAYHHRLFFWWYEPFDTSAMLRYGALALAFLLFAAGCVWSLTSSHRWPFWWPAAVLILWHLFGVNTLLTIVHTHDQYVITGVLALLSLVPALAIFAVRDHRNNGRSTEAMWGAVRRIGVGVRALSWKSIGAGAAVALLLAVLLVREARKEIDVFWLWYPVHVISVPYRNFDAQLWRSPSELLERVKHLDALGNAPPGSNDMYAAWIFWVYNYQNALFRRGPGAADPAAAERYKAEAQQYMLDAYRRALAKDPENPNYASYALMIYAPDWPEVFRRALSTWPAYHHSPYMAYHMIAQARTPEERDSFIRIYEDGVGALLSSTSGARPGHQPRPHLEPEAAEPKVDRVGVHRMLDAGERVFFDPIALEGAPKLRIGLFVQALQGQVHATVVDGDGRGVGSCTDFVAAPADTLRYRYVDCAGLDRLASIRVVLTALTPSTFVVRDYYPLFSVVRSIRN